MCLVSIYKRSAGFSFQNKSALGLAFRSIIGGKIGDEIFLQAVDSWGSPGSQCDTIRYFISLIGGIILFTINKERIRTLEVTESCGDWTIGLIVGIISVYLGLGMDTEYCTLWFISSR